MMKLGIFCLVLMLPVVVSVSTAMAAAPAAEETLQPMVESHYKIEAGKTDEWLERYTTQHLPILKEMQREGRILTITILRPFLHQGGSAWDFKVILRFRDFDAMGDRTHEQTIERRLFPNWDAHRQDERRRWEITVRHWDDIMTEVPTHGR